SGTRIGAGIELAVEAHDPRFRATQVQDILLLSDGHDPVDDNEWARVGIRAAQSASIPVYTVGIGDPVEEHPIPDADRGYLTIKGQTVKTRLMEKPLQDIAAQTKGTYTAARTGLVHLVELFRQQIEQPQKRESVDEAPPQYRKRYAWFFGVALLLLTLELTAGRRVKSEIRNTRSATNSKSEKAMPK